MLESPGARSWVRKHLRRVVGLQPPDVPQAGPEVGEMTPMAVGHVLHVAGGLVGQLPGGCP